MVECRGFSPFGFSFAPPLFLFFFFFGVLYYGRDFQAAATNVCTALGHVFPPVAYPVLTARYRKVRHLLSAAPVVQEPRPPTTTHATNPGGVPFLLERGAEMSCGRHLFERCVWIRPSPFGQESKLECIGHCVVFSRSLYITGPRMQLFDVGRNTRERASPLKPSSGKATKAS